MGILTLDWKTAHLSPIFKKGDKQQPGNYRPLSLMSVACKVVERLMKKKIMTFLEDNKLLSILQHGFWEKRSCISNLLSAQDSWTPGVDHR